MIAVAHMIATTITDPPTDVDRTITCCWVIDGDAEAVDWSKADAFYDNCYKHTHLRNNDDSSLIWKDMLVILISLYECIEQFNSLSCWYFKKSRCCSIHVILI